MGLHCVVFSVPCLTVYNKSTWTTAWTCLQRSDNFRHGDLSSVPRWYNIDLFGVMHFFYITLTINCQIKLLISIAFKPLLVIISWFFSLQDEYMLVIRALHGYIGTTSEKIYENLWKKTPKKHMYMLTKMRINDYVIVLYMNIFTFINYQT